jgi:hypothetical protein
MAVDCLVPAATILDCQPIPFIALVGVDRTTARKGLRTLTVDIRRPRAAHPEVLVALLQAHFCTFLHPCLAVFHIAEWTIPAAPLFARHLSRGPVFFFLLKPPCLCEVLLGDSLVKHPVLRQLLRTLRGPSSRGRHYIWRLKQWLSELRVVLALLRTLGWWSDPMIVLLCWELADQRGGCGRAHPTGRHSIIHRMLKAALTLL